MIISHKYKYIFIKVTKTAGTSIQQVLCSLGSTRDICIGGCSATRKVKAELPGVGPSSSAVVIRDAYPEYWNKYFKFGYTRNPWDRMVSLFCFKNKKNIDWSATFSDIKIQFAHQMQNIHNGWLTHAEYDGYMCPIAAISINNELAVDFVCRFENLEEDLVVVCKKLGIPHDISLPQTHHTTRKNKIHYSKWYDDITRDLVFTLFPKTITLFNYTFEDKRK